VRVEAAADAQVHHALRTGVAFENGADAQGSGHGADARDAGQDFGSGYAQGRVPILHAAGPGKGVAAFQFGGAGQNDHGRLIPYSLQ